MARPGDAKTCESCGSPFTLKGYYDKRTCSPSCSKKLQRETLGHPPQTKHGFAKVGQVERLHSVWRGMLKRCYCKTASNYQGYGGRGIAVCEEWKNDYLAFRSWATTNGYQDNLQIERIDNNGNYGPQNCKWATPKEQCQNRRTTRRFTVAGVTATTRYFAERKGIKFGTAYYQLTRGIY